VNPSPEFGMMVEAVADKRIEWALMIRISRLTKVFWVSKRTGVLSPHFPSGNA
jgi:hypothetical protein